MKTSCPNCGQHLEYGDDLAGSTASCPKCGAMVAFPSLTFCPDCGANVSRLAEVCPDCGAELSFPKLTVCPDCGAEISRRAKVCPHCGAPLGEPKSAAVETEESAIPTFDPRLFAPGKVSDSGAGIGVAVCVACGLVAFGYAFFWHSQYLFFAGIALWGFAVYLFGKRWNLRCGCGYMGKPKVNGEAGCLPALLLFCLGVIPGLLYLAFCDHPRFYCPRCGREGFK